MADTVRVRYRPKDGTPVVLELNGDPGDILNAVATRMGFTIIDLDPKFDEIMKKRREAERAAGERVGPREAHGEVVGRRSSERGRRTADGERPTLPDPFAEVQPGRQGPARAGVHGPTEERADRGPDLSVGVGAAPAQGVRDTSVAAYRGQRAAGKLTAQQQLVLQVFLDGKQRDWTRKEIARETGLEINVICGRVDELRRLGRIEESTEKRACRITGETVHVLRARAAMEQAA